MPKCGNENFRFSFRIKREKSTTTKRYHVTEIILYYISALSHNARCSGVLLLEVIALGTKKLLSPVIVIALVTARQKR